MEKNDEEPVVVLQLRRIKCDWLGHTRREDVTTELPNSTVDAAKPLRETVTEEHLQ